MCVQLQGMKQTDQKKKQRWRRGRGNVLAQFETGHCAVREYDRVVGAHAKAVRVVFHRALVLVLLEHLIPLHETRSDRGGTPGHKVRENGSDKEKSSGLTFSFSSAASLSS